MSELTTIARPYAKAAFDFAVEQSTSDKSAVEKWNEMLGFLAELVKNETMQNYLTGSLSAQKLADTVFFRKFLKNSNIMLRNIKLLRK